MNIKKTLASLLSATLVLGLSASAATHTVVRGDTMWKIANKYEVGTREIIDANPRVANPDLIYPGQLLNVPQTDSTVSSFEAEVVRLVNIERSKNGLKPLTHDWELSRVARYKSQDMKNKNYFAHESPTYGSPFDMMRSFGISYRSAGENIAKGQTTPQKVVTAWMNSQGHRANILNKNYTHIGVGYVASGNYWTQMFIQK
ncbi:MAG: SafA/ExsA family spore coat assembly protein [Clostridia bacterium]|nr:SafA/ExsA family spore coat assembly protein [Clostridia bacterium]MBO7289169.1 SafA/ExsA family spore coat assembly protein [Clostridia bacterium]